MCGSALAVLTRNLSSSGSACGNSMAAPAPASHLHSRRAKTQAKQLKELHLYLKAKLSQIAPHSHVPLVKSCHMANLSSKRCWEMAIFKKWVLEPFWKKRTIYFKESGYFQGPLVPICICSHETSDLRLCSLQDCRDL